MSDTTDPIEGCHLDDYNEVDNKYLQYDTEAEITDADE